MTLAAQCINAGHRPFTKAALAVYDALVLALTCRWIWRCPSERILALYAEHLSANHLEVGVGTGFFLERSRFPVTRPRLALLDLNANCLERTAARVARYRPAVYQANVLEPIALDGRRFDSIALNYVLHCLPGTLSAKAVVFEHLAKLLNPGGVIFGATVVASGAATTASGRAFMRLCNATGVFSNEHDDAYELEAALARHFSDAHVKTCGCVAIFSARRP